MANVTPEYVAEIIEKFEVSDENKQSGVLGIDGNCHWFYLFIFTHLLSLFFFYLGSVIPQKCLAYSQM